MRRAERATPEHLALEIFQAAPLVHLAMTDEEGAPILRAVHGVVFEGAVCFHSAPAGEKLAGLGRTAVVCAEQILATIPSSWTHPERACPATTWYQSAMMQARLESVEAPADRAAVLNLLMRRFQPEGGYRPIDAEDPMYKAAVRNLLIARVSPERVTGKRSVGQDKAPDHRRRVLEGLWGRGGPGDLACIDLALDISPETPATAFMAAPIGARLRFALDHRHETQAAALLRDQYWNTTYNDDQLRLAARGSTAWIGATDLDGALVATARAISDGVKFAWIMDVAVRPDWRGRGLGSAVMRALLDHPASRGARTLALRTRDATPFYERLGFTITHQETDRAHMVLTRQ